MRTCFVALLVVLTGSLTGCIKIGDFRTVSGSGNIVAETRDVRGFDRVSASGSGDLYLAQGAEESLTIEADDNLLPFIESEIRNGQLSVGPRNVNLRPTQRIVYHLKVKDLREFHLSGSMRAQADKIKAERLAVSISGSGKMEITSLEAETLSSRISGSGSTSVGGRVDRQEIRISGSGNHQAPELECSLAEAHISGSGDASLWVVEALDVGISGSGRVEYRGNARVASHVSGSGRVHRVN